MTDPETLPETHREAIKLVLQQWIATYGQQDDDPSVFPNGYDVREALEYLESGQPLTAAEGVRDVLSGYGS